MRWVIFGISHFDDMYIRGSQKKLVHSTLVQYGGHPGGKSFPSKIKIMSCISARNETAYAGGAPGSLILPLPVWEPDQSLKIVDNYSDVGLLFFHDKFVFGEEN